MKKTLLLLSLGATLLSCEKRSGEQFRRELQLRDSAIALAQRESLAKLNPYLIEQGQWVHFFRDSRSH